MSGPLLRPITAADHEDVLALNERHVELTAPMDGRDSSSWPLRPSTPT